MAVFTYNHDPSLVSDEVRKVFDVLFSAADDPSRTGEWLDCFSNDAKIWRNGKSWDGRAEIEGMLTSSWDNVASREHRPAKVFAYGQSSLDFMVDGTTVYNWKDGTGKTGVWAARLSLKEVNGVLKISDYHVVFV